MPPDATPEIEKSPEKSPDYLRGVAVDPLLRGRGAAVGAPNAGRPSNVFKDMCAGLQRGAILDKCITVIEDADKGPGHADWEWAVKWVGKFGERETARRMEHGGLDGGPILLEQILRDRADARRPALQTRTDDAP